jgi:hypothetical protein
MSEVNYQNNIKFFSEDKEIGFWDYGESRLVAKDGGLD